MLYVILFFINHVFVDLKSGFGLLCYIALHYITLHYITLHYITLHYITLHYITLHYITLHSLHYITLHHTTFQDFTLDQYIHILKRSLYFKWEGVNFKIIKRKCFTVVPVD